MERLLEISIVVDKLRPLFRLDHLLQNDSMIKIHLSKFSYCKYYKLFLLYFFNFLNKIHSYF